MPAIPSPIRLWDQALSALALLTRLPLPAHRPEGAASGWAWPLAGALIGAIGALVLWLSQMLGLGAAIGPVLALAVMAFVTGGLHEDGLADTVDGLWGGRTVVRRLEIMKDSRIGSYGTVALIFVILTQVAALSTSPVAIPALIAAAALSRAPMAVIMAALPPARVGGLSSGMGRPGAAVAGIACILALGIGAALVGSRIGVTALAVLATSLILALIARQKIGGQTGDILGASQQLSFTAALIALSA